MGEDRDYPFTCEQCRTVDDVHLYTETSCENDFEHTVVSVMCEACAGKWTYGKRLTDEELEMLR